MRAMLKLYGAGLLLVLLSIAGGKLWLSHAASELGDSLTSIEHSEQVTLKERGLADSLSAKQRRLERYSGVLNQLRDGVRAEQVFASIDQAVRGDVWFRKWTFRRSGVSRKLAPETTRAGYFLVIADDGNDGDRVWRMDTHMEIAGRAWDHSDLAELVRRLVEQPIIEDVKVLRTTSRRLATDEVVDFDLAITVAQGSDSYE